MTSTTMDTVMMQSIMTATTTVDHLILIVCIMTATTTVDHIPTTPTTRRI